MPAVLVLNAGSSSIKFALFDVPGAGRLAVLLRSQLDGIGTAPHFMARDAAGEPLGDTHLGQGAGDYEALLGWLLEWIEGHLGPGRLAAVGHRVVHGGREFVAPVVLTPAVVQALDALTPLAPLHQPHSLSPIRALAAVRPGLVQVACFDTAFHSTMPAVATRFALPRRYEGEGVRRYGFHGLSYEHVAQTLRATVPGLAAGRVVVAHLGNGASLCAMQDCASVDTTMGFTALDGLVMGTRCGSLDPGVVLYMLGQGMDARTVEQVLYQQSGLLGVSGVSSDMRVLMESADPHARDAVELFVYRIARETGAMAASLGGLDGFVFTAGIGEHAAEVRVMVCERLRWLGVVLDAGANARGAGRISTVSSPVEVHVVPADEEAAIARHTVACAAL